jgi:beta-lactamase superfamily II metal-dependent hydrolase
MVFPAIVMAGDFRFTQIDIGQGDSAVVVAPSGCAALLDGGPTGSGATIKSYLKSIGVTSLDFVISSHHHADHIGGMDEVDVGTDAVPIAAVYDRGGSYSSSAFTQYASHFSGRRNTVSVGQVISLCSEVTFTVVAVNGNGLSTSDENALSVVVKISYGAFDAVVGGDATSSLESLIGAGIGQVELYKVHHHGSRGSSSNTFLDAISPTVGFISLGFDNSYGHPHPEAVSRLQSHGVEIWQTEDAASGLELGHIQLSSANGSSYTVTQGSTSRTYQSHGGSLPDTTPPTAPADLAASASARDQIDLTWSPSTDDVGVVEYRIFRSADGVAFSLAGTSTSAGFADLGLPSGTTFWYRVTARDAAGNESPASNTAQATTLVPSLAVTAPNGGESWSGGSTQTITWTKANVGGVTVAYSLDNGATWTTLASGVTGTSLSWTVPGTATTQGRVLVTDTAHGAPSDQSDGTFTITASTPARVVLNEILANEPGSSTAGECVEIANVGGTPIDISGWRIIVGGTTRHTFASGTTLLNGKAMVVFGAASGIPPGTPGAVAASSGSLGLTNSGNTVAVRGATGPTIDSFTYGSSLAGVDGVSMNRNPDATADAPFVLHTQISSLDASPGWRADGSSF